MRVLEFANALPVLGALVLALVMTPLVIATARQLGMVAQPKPDRWHRKPTAMLGGIAVVLAVLGGFLMGHPTPMMWYVLAASVGMCALGLVDDVLHIRPYQKLVVQILGAAAVMSAGLLLPWTASVTLNMVITLFWLIGITNAMNLLDNMDGLAAGVAVIASCFLALNFALNGQVGEAVMVLIFAAAILGFLVYNFDPASVFMGDCGSMFIGFFLASSALLSSADRAGRARSLLPVLAIPILIFAIPIFDTTFVTVVRKLSGRAASQGGRDHTSHRLVALGMTERRAVLMLYGFAMLAGLIALATREMQLDVSLAMTGSFVTVLTLGGVHLAGVKVYGDTEGDLPKAALYAFFVDLSYKRRIFEVLLDSVLVVLAYYLSFLNHFGPFSVGAEPWQAFVQILPVIVGSMMASALACGVYRGVWRYTGLSDIVVICKAVVVGSLVSAGIIAVAFPVLPPLKAASAMGALLLVTLMAASRISFRILKPRRASGRADTRRRAIIYGAGDAGERILQELLHNSDLPYLPIGFIDDDTRKTGRVIHGLPVYKGNGSAAMLCQNLGVEEIIVSSQSFAPTRISEIASECALLNIGVVRAQIHFERVPVAVRTA